MAMCKFVPVKLVDDINIKGIKVLLLIDWCIR